MPRDQTADQYTLTDRCIASLIAHGVCFKDQFLGGAGGLLCFKKVANCCHV